MINRNTIAHPKCFNTVFGKTDLNKLHISIQQSLRLIITTNKGELLGDPRFGSNLLKYLEEPNSEIQYELIRDDLLEAISEYERRITVINMNFNKPDSKTISIIINYELVKIEGDNKKGNLTFSILLPDKNY